MNNPLTLTISLTDHAACLTVKREIHYGANDDVCSTRITQSTFEVIEELQTMLAIAQSQIKPPAALPDTGNESRAIDQRCSNCGGELGEHYVKISTGQSECLACGHPLLPRCPICGKITKQAVKDDFMASLANPRYFPDSAVCACPDPGRPRCALCGMVMKGYPVSHPSDGCQCPDPPKHGPFDATVETLKPEDFPDPLDQIPSQPTQRRFPTPRP